jgi:hypothetical protein
MKDELRDELSDLPFLRKMKEQPDGLQVPKHYFRYLPDEVLRKAKQSEPTPVPHAGWMERLEQFVAGLRQPRLALAFASLLVLVVAAVVFFANNGQHSPTPAAIRLEDITDDELLAYVSDNIRDFDHDLVAETAGPELPELKPISKTTPSLPKSTAPKPEVEEMEDYIDEVIDEIDVEDLEELF